MFTAAKMTEVLATLFDGEWHTLKEIQQKTELDKNRIQRVMEFLERYGFITVDKAARRVILDKAARKFLTQVNLSHEAR